MAKLVLPSKACLLVLGKHNALEPHLQRMGNRMGFSYIKTESQNEFSEALRKIKSLAGIIICDDQNNLPTIPPGLKQPLHIKCSDPIAQVLKQLDAYFSSSFPKNLNALIENSARKIIPLLFEVDFGKVERNLDFTLRFTNLIICDSTAEGFSAKASCEVDIPRMKQLYPKLSDSTDAQLIDTFAEMCNQLLGMINGGLRTIGVNPLLSLPIGAELSKNSLVAQVDFMPMSRLTDQFGTFAVGVACKIEPKCNAHWEDLPTIPPSEETEFF